MDIHETNPYRAPIHTASATPAEFVLKGCLTVDDAIAANRLATRSFWLRVTLAAMLLFLLWSVLVFDEPQSSMILLVACVLLPGVLVVFHVVGRLRLRRFARNQFGMFAPTHSTISADGILATSENAQAQFEWSFFSQMRVNGLVVVLFYKNSPGYLILARSKLTNPDHWNGLVESVRAWIESADT